jgi:hypothetical protein
MNRGNAVSIRDLRACTPCEERLRQLDIVILDRPVQRR